MKIEINENKIDIDQSKTSAQDSQVDAAVVFVEEDSKEIQNIAKKSQVDMRKEEFNGKFDKIAVLSTHNQLKAKNIIIVGLGKKEKITRETMRRAASIAAKRVRDAKYEAISIDVENVPLKYTDTIEAITEGFLLALYSFDKYKPEKSPPPKKVILCSNQDIGKSIEKSIILIEQILFVRNIVNTPASDMTPRIFTGIATTFCKKYGIRIRIIKRAEAKKLGFNAFLAVARGSVEEPYFLIAEWNKSVKNRIALVGKGITFDSGGLDIKPADYMLGMHGDMEGAAVVLSSMIAAARFKLPVHVVGIMPLTENMPSGSSYKPGDIIHAYNGKTIEVVNTDAEGRVILSDALAFVEKNYNPEAIIDFATLTGACVVALGNEAAGLMGNDEKLISKIKTASEKTDERVWQLPLWDDYKEMVKSDVADVRNTGKEKGAGTITGAAFLEAFVKDTPWAHLDIAGVTMIDKNKYYMSKGSTGWGVRLVYQLLKDWKK